VAAALTALYAGVKIYGDFRQRNADYEGWQQYWEHDMAPSQRANFRKAVEFELGGSDQFKKDKLAPLMVKMKRYADYMEAGGDLAPYNPDDPWNKDTNEHDKFLVKKLYAKVEDYNAKDMARVVPSLRDAVDKHPDFLSQSFNPKSLTGAERAALRETWDRLPKEARSAAETKGGKEDWDGKVRDLQVWAKTLNIRSSRRLTEDIDSFLSTAGSKIAAISGTKKTVSVEVPGGTIMDEQYDAGSLTGAEEDTLRSLWIQRGGDPRVPLGIQAIGLSSDGTMTNTRSTGWVSSHIDPYLDQQWRR